MSNRFKRSWQLANSSWKVLNLDKKLLLIPLLESVVILLVLALFAVLLISTVDFSILLSEDTPQVSGGWIATLGLVIFSIITTFIANFFAGAIFFATFQRFKGTKPGIKQSLSAVWAKRREVLLFTLFSVTIGLIIDFISEHVPFAGNIVAWLGGIAWAVASFFAIPIIIDNKETIKTTETIKKSANTIKKAWGESVIINIGIGLVVGIGVILYGALSASSIVLLSGISSQVGIFISITSIAGLVVILFIASVLSNIAKAAIYYWAKTGTAPEYFQTDLLKAAMTHKKARKIFSTL